MATATDAVRALHTLSTAAAAQIAHAPTGIEPGYDPATGITWGEDGRARYRRAQGGILVASATVSTPQTIPNATTTTIDFDNIVSDPGGCISGSGSGWIFTAPRDGYYMLLHGNQIDTNTWSVGGRDIECSYIKNGSGGYLLDRQWPVSGFAIAPFLQGFAVIPLIAGDTLAIRIYQNRGGSVQTGSAGECFIQILSVG